MIVLDLLVRYLVFECSILVEFIRYRFYLFFNRFLTDFILSIFKLVFLEIDSII